MAIMKRKPFTNSLREDIDEIVHTRHRYQINFTQALSKRKGVIALLFLDTGRWSPKTGQCAKLKVRPTLRRI